MDLITVLPVPDLFRYKLCQHPRAAHRKSFLRLLHDVVQLSLTVQAEFPVTGRQDKIQDFPSAGLIRYPLLFSELLIQSTSLRQAVPELPQQKFHLFPR